jgi:hypothetical protein
MPDFNVIADVSQLLQVIITDGLKELVPQGQTAPIAEINDLQAAIPATDLKATLFLFEITEDASARNRPRVHKTEQQKIVDAKPAMTLLLKYLITAWAGDPVTEHRMLGRVLQMFYDNPIITAPPQNAPSGVVNYFSTGEALKMSLSPLTLEERTRVWHAVQQPYKLSLSYEARVVNLDTRVSRVIPPVQTRNLNYFAPAVMR